MSDHNRCAQCGAELPPDAPGGHCLNCLLQLGLSPGEPAEKPGDRVGRYKLLQMIGEGGYGMVYMAEQEEPVRRRVALKIIKLGMDTRQVIARFEAERQALALMDHPNIAKVLDAGATETGRPYFVMELVRGIKITEYCNQKRFTTRQRLELFIQVCQAVQHAHQKGIIHRDLKPSNILVTEQDGRSVPKIIDFGIAKATAGQPLTDKTLFTAFEQFIGTPAYMSPEQAGLGKLDIDTRSDIYSLGILLYELLTGQPPFDLAQLRRSAIDEVLRTIRETEPPRPSNKLTTLSKQELTVAAQQRQIEPAKLSHILRGDLDWIVMKAMEKERNRRYETANGLARDLERFLTDEPVWARPPSAAYRLTKTIRRHKLAFVTCGAVLAALIIGLGAASWQAIRATRAEREQSRQREAAEKETKFVKGMLKSAPPRMIEDTNFEANLGILGEMQNAPETEAELRTAMADAYANLGLYEDASAMRERANSLLQNLHSRGGSHGPANPIVPLIYGLGTILSGVLAALAVRTFRRRLRIFTFLCVPVSFWILGMALAFVLLGAETAMRLLGCSMLAAIFTAGWAIFLSRRTRSPEPKRKRFPVNPCFDVLGGVGFFLGLLAAFYVVENWRGKHAWEECRRDLEAGGAVLDWRKYIQPPVPDEQNFFKTPKMAEWFGCYGGPKPADDLFHDWQSHKHLQIKLADIVVIPVFPNTNAGDAGPVLQFDSLDPALFKFSTNSFTLPTQLADVPLTTAIETLARVAGIQYVLDPTISRIWRGKQEPTITGRWQNITPADLLFSLIDQHGLQLVPNPDTGVALVTVKDPHASRIHLSPEESDKMKELLQKVIGTNAFDFGRFPLLATLQSEIKPARIALHSKGMPTDEEIADLFRQCYPNADQPAASLISFRHTGLNRVEVFLKGDSAAGCLEWSDQAKPDLGLIRQALKRPYALRDGDYTDLSIMKPCYFGGVRTVVTILGTRATCHLLLNQPDEALSDLTLLNDTRRISETRPMTLVSAMLNVAVCGAYTRQIALGLRLRAWKEPQLAALQRQLESINLFPDIASGLRTDQAISVTFNPVDFHPPDFLILYRTNLWQKLRNPELWTFDIAPRGWLDQNRAVAATIYEKQIRSFTTHGDVFSPEEIDAAMKEVATIKGRESPFTLIARVVVPDDVGRSLQAAAYVQTMIDQAQIACSLERYCQVHGIYPETLDALTPQFIGKAPCDPIGGRPFHYRRTADGTFLLYSVGWNGTDDGGKGVRSQAGSISVGGDWVWNQ